MSTANQNIRKDPPSQLLNYLQLLWFRKRLILAITIVVGALGLFWLGGEAPVYRSTSGLMIGAAAAGPAGAGESSAAPYHIDNEIEVLRSRALVSEVVKRFQLQVYSEFDPSQVMPAWGVRGFVASLLSPLTDRLQSSRQPSAGGRDNLSVAIDIFLEKLSLERAGDSNVVNISFLSVDPRLAAQIANALPEAYIAAQLQAKIDNSEAVSSRLSEQFKRLSEQFTASQRAEEYYRKTLGSAEADRLAELDQQLSDLNSRLRIARAQKADAVERLGQIKAFSGEAAGLEDAASQLSSYPLIQQLIARKAELAKAAAGAPGDADAPRQPPAAVETEVATINTAIRAEFDRIVIELQAEAAAASLAADELEAELTRVVLESSTQHRRLLSLRALEEETALNRVKFEAFVDQFKDASSVTGTFAPDSRLISLADASVTALYPGRPQKMAVFVLAGLVLGVSWVFLLQLRNPGLLSPEHVEQVLGGKTIGVIPIVPGKQRACDHLAADPDSEYASAVKALKITLDLSDLDHKVRAVQLVSSVPGEGKTSLAISLAQTVAGFGQKVLLVNGSLRSTAIEEKLGLPLKAKGLTDLMLSTEDRLAEFVMTGVKGGIHFLPAGTASHADADVVFSSQRMASIVAMMRADYDFILFDAPPLRLNADAVALGRQVDKTLFVIRWNKTPMKVAGEALRQLRAGAIDLAGVVLQQVNLQRYGEIAYSDYGYIYNQRY